jgi:hypothetical protein
MELEHDEGFLLAWLGEDEFSQYGECHGKALDGLIEKGLAELMGEESEWNNTFIAKGRGIMYRAVRLTEAGHEELRSRRAAAPPP